MSFGLLQFLIVEEPGISQTQLADASFESVNKDDETDDGFSEIWKHITLQWRLDPPKLIISVIDDSESYLMNQLLLQSILVDLVKAAATGKGKHCFEGYTCCSGCL